MPPTSSSRDPEYKLVHLRLLAPTIRKVEELERWLGSKTRTAAVKNAIEIAHLVVQAMIDEKRVFIEEKDGTRAQILIPGVSGDSVSVR